MRKNRMYIPLGLIAYSLCWGCSSASNETTVSTETETVVSFTGEAIETSEEVTETEAPTTEPIAETTTEAPTETVPETTWSPSSLKDAYKTSIEYDKRYNAVVGSEEDAIKVIKMYGDMQKAGYDNPKISEIEAKMESEFDIAYVALGELDEETANEIYQGFKYMYDTYPELQGTLTDFTLGNFTWNAMAQTRTFEFVTNNNAVPIVLKREIIISSDSFLDRKHLLSGVALNEEQGFWPRNSSVSMIIVHELGHHLLDVHTAKLHGFTGCYVTSENHDAYRAYAEEFLSWNQAEIKRIISSAYTEWLKTNEGSEEDFRGSISGYAKGIQSDGGISYTETFAEAIADIYANGETAVEASKLILAAM